MKTYKQPRRRGRASRMRATLHQMSADNHREWAAVTMESSEIEARARLQERFPDETPEQIEGRVQFVMRKGIQPTTATALKPGTIPKEVLMARKAERKKQVKANRPRRQAEERLRKATMALHETLKSERE